MDARDVIIRPFITERSTELMEENTYTFEVALNATKPQVRRAVEEIFKVRVVRVNTSRLPGKLKRMGRTEGRRPERKKALVQLAAGDHIELFDGL